MTTLAIDPGPERSGKRCRKCGVISGEFYRCRLTSDGLASWCIPCEKGRDRAAYTADYRTTGSYLEAQRKYRASEKYKASNREALRRTAIEKKRAHEAVRSLDRPDRCADCGSVGQVHGHHEDYSKPLDVAWICPKCHVARHRKGLAA